jgi:hypothetical protein
MEIQGSVGMQAPSAGDGVLLKPYMGRQGQLIVQDFLPRYFELAYRGLLFNGANQAGQAISNLVAVATGLILINPLGSNKLITLIDVALAQTSVAAAAANAAIVLAVSNNPQALGAYTLTTPLAINPAIIGTQPASVVRLCSAATLPAAPTVARVLWQPSVSATATTAIPPYIKDEIAGAIGIAPGCAVSLSAATALSAMASITWAEIPL